MTTHTMHIFGAGWGRTGTTSIQRALSQLGYRAYNFEAVLHENHLEMWGKVLKKEIEPEWSTLFAGYDSTIAWPACFFYEELMVAYPQAKFILTTRDPERWADSFLSSYKVLEGLKAFRFIPRARMMTDFMQGAMLKYLFGDSSGPERENVIRQFNQHNEAVQQHIPAERLLVYEVTQGWEPLCTFLDKPMPNTPFPYENKGENFKQMAYRLLGINAGKKTQ